MTHCPYVRESVAEDLVYLEPRLRDADKREIRDVTGLEPMASLSLGYKISKPCFTILAPKTGDPFAILGVVPEQYFPEMGMIWMHCTNDLPPFSFLRYAKTVLYDIIGGQYGYEVVSNYVDARNEVHVRWLRWMGAKLLDVVHVEGSGVPVHPFIINLCEKERRLPVCAE